jgi:glycosyltransferase involved in cell wall biosynthesis
MQKITFISSCVEDWGGSEELWGRSIPFLQQAGYQISVLKFRINRNHPQFIRLSESNVELFDIDPIIPMPSKVLRKINQTLKKISFKIGWSVYPGEDFSQFNKLVQAQNANLVVISQGINFDGLKYAYQCFLLKIPYVVISQKAVDFYWPHKNDRYNMLQALKAAKKCYFVSRHNLTLTEEQFGHRLPNAEVIFNPVKLSGHIVPFPPSNGTFKIACIGRLFLLDKGQDILIRILSSEKWKQRPLSISFIGKGDDEQALSDMAELLGVKNVNFMGQIEDIEKMWEDYHALILPSRSEGLPLSMVEAMAAGRPVIISDAGGNAEMVEEGVTGFIGDPYHTSFEAAMERAWQNREHWQEMGQKASVFVSQHVPKCPESDFAQDILVLLKS